MGGLASQCKAHRIAIHIGGRWQRADEQRVFRGIGGKICGYRRMVDRCTGHTQEERNCGGSSRWIGGHQTQGQIGTAGGRCAGQRAGGKNKPSGRRGAIGQRDAERQCVAVDVGKDAAGQCVGVRCTGGRGGYLQATEGRVQRAIGVVAHECEVVSAR